MRRIRRLIGIASVVFAALWLGGCPANVGVGVSVGVPVGNHGYMSVGASRWR
jgi:hypothetical protein